MADERRAVRARADELDRARAAMVDATAVVERLRRERAAVGRRDDPRDPLTAERRTRMDGEIAAAEAVVDDRRRAVGQLRARLREVLKRIGEQDDPVREAAQLDVGVPLLLLPVRIETRFKGRELWVRVYPDDWAVDTFEAQLTDDEVASVRRFWASLFRARDDEDLRRAAWAAIVASHGSGRAGWLIHQHEPLNPGDAPAPGDPDDVILVVATDQTLSPTETGAVATYWEGVWRRQGDPDGTLVSDLGVALGPELAAVMLTLPPATLDEPRAGLDRQTAVVRVVVCAFPAVSADSTKTSSWTTAPRANVLPDRLVLLGYEGSDEVAHVLGEPIPPTLVVGPDPAAGPGDQFRIEDGDLVVPDDLRWMVDFDEAVAAGMAFRVPLDERTQGGFDRLFVVGLRVDAKPEADQAELETLLANHRRSRKGLSLLAQGTPTNNTENDPAGYDRLDDPDASYDLYLGSGSGLVDDPSWETKQDGQWLAECLGIDPASLALVSGSAGTDQAEARAMNVALWPATLGYFLDAMMHPLLEGGTVDETRAFFLDHVSGRGRVPALRIGRQPYGVLPTTALSRLRFRREGERPTHDAAFLTHLSRMMQRAADDWAPLVNAVPHVHGGGEPHQTLLDVVALHPASVEFHQRYAEAIEDIFNRFAFDALSGQFVAIWEALGSVLGGRQLLADLDYAGSDSPDILAKLFHGRQHRLKGPIVDDRPLSETAGIRAYCDDQRNYLEWLVEAASSSLDALRRQDGFSGDKQPTALLYLLLRHALLLSWWDAGVRFRLDAGLLDAAAFRAARREPTFVHIAGNGPSESRWSALYDGAAVLTGDDRTALAEWMPHVLDRPPARHLAEVIAAIARLRHLPTARLERLLAEHLDLCSHRLDAWRLGLVNHRLLQLRDVSPGGGTPRRGVHLGVYGWLEDVRAEAHTFDKVSLPDELVKTFGRDTDPPLVRDASNGGYIHAPSLNHAATAAILRSGFLANATPAHPDTMALNISSERMRLAISVLQGLRNGQTLGALLGYRFERGLHDRHGLAEVDSFIFPLRKAFPAPGDRDGRLPLDGLALVRHVQETGNRVYPFGKPALPAAPGDKQTAIDLEVERLLDVHDAVADLVLAEGVHQAVLGNFDRVAATLDSVSRGGFPTEPAVLETPHTGITVVHRFGLHLRPGLDHTVSPVAGLSPTPRAMAEPAVNELLAALLPAPGDVVATVVWTAADGAPRSRMVTQAELGLQPIDLLHVLRLEDQSALGELDERILRQVEVAEGLGPDVVARVLFTERVAGSISLFQLAPLIGHLRTLVTRSRPLRPTDVLPSGDARASVDAAAVHADRARPAAVLTALELSRTDLADLANDLGPLLADPVAHRAELLAQVDTFVDRVIDALANAGLFGLGGTGWGDLAERRRTAADALRTVVADLVTRWEARLARADAQLAADDALPTTATDEERIRGLLLADREVRAAVTDPVPTAADVYRAEIDAQRGLFSARLQAFRVATAAGTALHGALAAATALLPIAAFDATPFDLAPVEQQILDLCTHLHSRVTSVIASIDTRRSEAASRLSDHDTAADGPSRVSALQAAVKALLGEDGLFVPEFDLAPAQGDEWDAAMAWSRTGNLTAHLTERDFPVDDWLHSVARVREKVRAFEQARLLAFAAGRPEPDLWPVQLPHASEPWVALELPDGFALTGERIVYAAHYPAAFDKHASQVGLLVDEWTEVIPGNVAGSGVTFNYDSPDSEPPQTMLLVVPPDPAAGWQWDDIVATLHETLALARLRAVEPDQVAATRYAAFLPATVTAATVRGLSIAANFALNNDLLAAIRVEHA